jgi:hypothetical protein
VPSNVHMSNAKRKAAGIVRPEPRTVLFRRGGLSMTNVRRQSWQTWIWRNLDRLLFVVCGFCFACNLGTPAAACAGFVGRG